MPGLVPGIHAFLLSMKEKTWMAGTSPAMTGDHGSKTPGSIVEDNEVFEPQQSIHKHTAN